MPFIPEVPGYPLNFSEQWQLQGENHCHHLVRLVCSCLRPALICTMCVEAEGTYQPEAQRTCFICPRPCSAAGPGYVSVQVPQGLCRQEAQREFKYSL